MVVNQKMRLLRRRRAVTCKPLVLSYLQSNISCRVWANISTNKMSFPTIFRLDIDSAFRGKSAKLDPVSMDI